MSNYTKSKYETSTLDKINILADEICVFPQNGMKGKITYGGYSRGERKNLPILVKVIEEGRHRQFCFELQGDYHVEDLVYSTIEPTMWRSYGKLWFDCNQGKKLTDFITKWGGVEEKPKQENTNNDLASWFG